MWEYHTTGPADQIIEPGQRIGPSGALNWSRKISTGSKLGGIHWGMAVDSEKVYVAATDFEIDTASGSLDDLMLEAKPGIYALNQATGELVLAGIRPGRAIRCLFSLCRSKKQKNTPAGTDN
jgi:hypothetical protein